MLRARIPTEGGKPSLSQCPADRLEVEADSAPLTGGYGDASRARHVVDCIEGVADFGGELLRGQQASSRGGGGHGREAGCQRRLERRQLDEHGRHLLHGEGAHLLYGRERQRSSPLPERTRAHERRVSPAPFEIASSQFAMAAGPGRPGALLGWCLIFDLLTSYELLSAPHPCSKTA